MYVPRVAKRTADGTLRPIFFFFLGFFFLFYRLLLYPRVRGWKESQSYIIFDDGDWMLFWKATLFTYN